jgi:hypothetical protein
MTPEQIFQIVNLIALASWLALAALPRREWVTDFIVGRAVPVLLALLYTAVVAANWGGSEGGFSSLPAVATLFGNPWLLLAGWIHYLAFDLFVGSWEVRDARERGISHVLVLPCLALTFLFGPAGWMLYLMLRSRHGTRA